MCENKQSSLSCLKTKDIVGKRPSVRLVPTSVTSTIYSITGEFGRFSELFTIDATTGDVTFIGITGNSFFSLAVDPTSHIMYGITSRSNGFLYVIDKSTGQVSSSPIPITGLTSDPNIISDMAIDSKGNAYFLDTDFDTNTVNLYSLNLNTGQANFISTIYTGDPYEASITFGPGDIAYVTVNFFLTVGISANLYSVNVNTGVATLIAPLSYSGFSPILPGTTGFIYDPETGLFYVTVDDSFDETGNFASIDVTTGVITFINDTGLDPAALAVDTVTNFTVVIQPQAPGVKFKMGPCC
jgi:hypothetical protein